MGRICLNLFVMKIDLKPNEMVVKASNSTYLNGQKINGKLILTNQRIYFKSEYESYNQEIVPGEIREVIPFKTGFFSDNGLNIVRKDGKELNFRVKDRDTWCKLVNQM
jgi:hypothetical protein